ncbi:MAG: ATP-dependent RecD-like DNA helicase [Nitrospirota bacterium]
MTDKGKETEDSLTGNVERITYVNEENGYTVARIRVKGAGSLVPIVGYMPTIGVGETLELYGRWMFHKEYGRQFSVSSYTTSFPSTANGIKRYLASSFIKGIGPIMADRIVDKFGADTLDIIENTPERLSEVDGIGEQRIGQIKEAWDAQKEIRGIMIFLQGYDITPNYSIKIFKRYGKDSIEVIRENPYRLAQDIIGIGFKSADKIAQKIGIPADSINRAEAGVLYFLWEIGNEGHVYYPYNELIDKVKTLLQIDRDIIAKAIERLFEEKKIIIEHTPDKELKSYRVEELRVENLEFRTQNSETLSKIVYLPLYYYSEIGIATLIKRISSAPSFIRAIDGSRALEWVEKRLDIRLAEKQSEAILSSAKNKILIITGGPGTGKTTIIRAITKIFEQRDINIILSAPTGRAAKRLSESTGREAKTIHRLLEYSFQQGGFKRNQDYPLECDLIVIDEVSMIDTILMNSLLKAVPLHAIVIFVGDGDQLPSVGAGNVLKDIIASGAIPVIRLNEIFRQAGNSLINTNAHRINSGKFPIVPKQNNSLLDFYMIDKDVPGEVADTIVSLYKDRIPSRFGFDAIKDIQVITPMHRGEAGVANLNRMLQDSLNPSKREIIKFGQRFRVRDKVMQITNNYDKAVFNGDIGEITGMDEEEHEITVSFDGHRIVYEFSELDEITLAYAVSVHKSQGSEYPAVILPLITQHYIMLQRNLLYTAVTRAKRLVVIVGTKKALAIAIRNNKVLKRYTGLRDRLL